jgi:hypothetical protein
VEEEEEGKGEEGGGQTYVRMDYAVESERASEG